MPCFIILAVLLFPRIVLVLMWFFSTYLQRAFHGGLLLPVLGFLFLPLTTAGIHLVWLLIAVIAISVGWAAELTANRSVIDSAGAFHKLGNRHDDDGNAGDDRAEAADEYAL
jgi:hypothetical protein